MMRVFLWASFVLLSYSSIAQNKSNANLSRPKLVVGIVIDQMRWDYLYKFYGRYSENGFKRLLKDGFSCENTLIPYMPTYTAPGHTCIYTGSVPAIHGIVGNNWWVKETGKSIYCTDDSTVLPVAGSRAAGKMSPRNMLTTTISDELRLSNNFKSKVFGIALKDRGGILPAGHTANAAYWYDDSTGNWMTSTYYMNSLPQWVQQFNSKKLPDAYLLNNWNTLYSINTYTLSVPDTSMYELKFYGEKLPVFPHKTEKASYDKAYKELRYSPYGNNLTIAFAKAMIESENLGKNGVTDLLAVSFSSTDYVGHKFGVNSVEVEDTYLRLDIELGKFLDYLDQKIGKGQYLIFLTADHGAAHVPEFMNQNKIPAGEFILKMFRDTLSKKVEAAFGIKRAVLYVNNSQVYLNRKAIDASPQSAEIYNYVLSYAKNLNFVQDAFYLADMYKTNMPQTIRNMLQNGYNANRSGDLEFIVKPGWIEDGDHSSTHGYWNPNDAHIPLLWYGWNIKAGKTNRETYMTDIAATLAALLHIQMPNGCIGKVIEEVMK